MSPGRAWEAQAYDRVSVPQRAWAADVIDRLELRGDETVLDAGCGSGQVTALLLERLPRGRVIAVDADESMVHAARERLPEEVEVRQLDLLELTVDEPVDAAFSSAVFHWVLDHETLFARLAAALRPGGRLSAQCGGEGNVARVTDIADRLAGGRPRLWLFAGPDESAARLAAAGFADIETWLEPRPTVPPDPPAFLETVVLGPYIEQMPEEERRPFVRAVLDELGDPPELDYVRLNIVARMPSEAVD